MNAFMIHGAYGNPDENWFPWMKKGLEALGYEVFIPKFPTPKGQTLKSWLDVFNSYQHYMNKDSIMIGHSIGAAFILDVLEKLDKPARASFLVAGFTGLLGSPVFDSINKTFVDKPFNWKKIKSNCSSFFVYHSDNDPYVPLKYGKDVAKNLGVDLTVVKGAGHFNESSGYKKFEVLLKEIKKLKK